MAALVAEEGRGKQPAAEQHRDEHARYHRHDQNFTPGLGFAGIAVALLGRNHAVGMAVGSAAGMVDMSGMPVK